jgi:anthranilate synthase component 2
VDKEALLFRGMPVKFEAARYHSWIAAEEDFPEILKITARDEEGGIMALEHKNYNVSAVQFHPESILTPLGEQMVRNFMDNLQA